MKSLFIVVALALASFVHAEDVCNAPPSKTYREPFRCKPGLVKKQCGKRKRCVKPEAPVATQEELYSQEPPRVVEAQPVEPAPEPGAAAAEPVTITAAPVAAEAAPTWLFEPHIAVGPSLCSGVVSTLIGARFRDLDSHLGIEPYLMVDQGFGLQVLGYPVQTDVLDLHLNVGIFRTGLERHVVASDVNRKLDITAGAGIEVPLVWHLRATVDYRWAYPLGASPAVPGVLSRDRLLTNTFRGSLVLGGLLLAF